MTRQLLARIQAMVIERPGPVLVASAVLVALALVAGSGVEFRTSRSELAPGDDADQRRWDELLDEHDASEALIVALEPERADAPLDPTAIRRFADRLAAAFRDDPLVGHVFHRIDLDWFLDRGLYLLPPDRLRLAVGAVEARGEALRELVGASDLAQLDRALAGLLRESLDRAGGAGAESGAEVMRQLARLLRWQRELLEDPVAAEASLGGSSLLALAAGQQTGALAGGGYPATRDGRTLFMFVAPAERSDSLAARKALIAALRARFETVSAQLPGFRIAFAGQPAQAVEEMESVRRDTWVTSLVAVVGVSLLTLLVFRWRSHALYVLMALAAGVVWAFGAVRLELGYLNMITSSFISTLIGVGVAYGIHPVSEYELEGAHTVDPGATVLRAFQRTGPGVTVAAVTTSAAFFSILLMRFRGFAELGLVAGFGVLLCLLAAVITLPALLVVFGRRRRARERVAGARRSSAVDRVWVERIAGRLCRWPWGVSGVSIAITVVAVWLALGLRFDTNILDLLPRDAESLRYQRLMVFHSDLSPLYDIAVADDRQELDAIVRRAAAEPTIERVDSALQFLPADPGASAALIDRLRPFVESLSVAPRATPLTAARLEAACAELSDVLGQVEEAAFAAGVGDVVAPLEDALTESDRCGELAAAAAAEQVAAWNRAQTALLDRMRRTLADLRRSLDTPPPTIATLPPEVRQRYLTSSGRYLAFLMPAGDVFDTDFLSDYVAASRRIDPEATGFPLVFHNMSDRITAGFYRAVLARFGAVFVLLLIDFRSLRHALLAMLPLAAGVAWMMGGMRLAGISFNFANLVAVPLIIGVGIDNGVHIMHRIRLEGHEGMSVVLRHTGRAILIASLTTMIGFGSLSLASHRGLASLGMVLLMGVGACLVTSTVVLPNLLVAAGRFRR